MKGDSSSKPPAAPPVIGKSKDPVPSLAMSDVQQKRRKIGNIVLMWINDQWRCGKIKGIRNDGSFLFFFKDEGDKVISQISRVPFYILEDQKRFPSAKEVMTDFKDFGNYSGCLTDLFDSVEDLAIWIADLGIELVSFDQIKELVSSLILEFQGAKDAVINIIITIFKRKPQMVEALNLIFIFTLERCFSRDLTKSIKDFRMKIVNGRGTLDVLIDSPILICLAIVYSKKMEDIVEAALIKLECDLQRFQNEVFERDFTGVRVDESRFLLVEAYVIYLYGKKNYKRLAVDLMIHLYMVVDNILSFDPYISESLEQDETEFHTLIHVQNYAKSVKRDSKNKRFLGVICPYVLQIAKGSGCLVSENILELIYESCSDVCNKEDLENVREFLKG